MSILTACLFVFSLTMSFSSCGDDASGSGSASGSAASGSAASGSGSGSGSAASGSAAEDLGNLDMAADTETDTEKGSEAPAK